MSVNLAELPYWAIGNFRQKTDHGNRTLQQPAQLNLFLYLPASLNRDLVESFIHRQFRRMYGAEIKHYPPYLLTLEHPRHEILAATGFRQACNEQLFLEKYLEAPVELVLSRHEKRIIDRKLIIEAGNLASDSPGYSRLLIMTIVFLLNQQGFEWVVMTGTRGLVNSFAKLHLQPLFLARAEAACLGAEQYDWGSYYTHHPQVMAGNIQQCNELLLDTNAYQEYLGSLRAFNFPPCSD